ncbi:TonB-dependent receptor [Selenomonadales bacterium OttesenSCG-928-I06]|nr:TonB-dependent receptor [Selenomonadales bacterium OttesenSCG-928-I06]
MFHKSKKALTTAAMIGFLISSTGYALAEEVQINEEDSVIVSGKEAEDNQKQSQGKKSGDVVVSATRTEQEIKETPAAVQVITREDLDNLGAQTLADALKLATSIDVGSPAMTGRSVTVRGMSSRHVLILVDGKRQVSEGSYSTVNTYELERINMDNIERIEIVRGPVSSLYGSEGMSGVVNIITRKPEKQEFTLSLTPWRYGKHTKNGGTDNYFFRYDSGIIDDKMGFIFSYDRQSISPFENYDRGAGTHDSVNNQYGHRDSYNFEFTYDLSKRQHLDFSADYQHDKLKGRSSTTQYETYDNKRKQFSVGLRGETDKSNYQLRMYYGEHEKDGPVYNYHGGSLTDFDVSERKTWVFEGHISSQLWNKHLTTIGAEYRTEDYWGTRVDRPSSSGKTIIRDGITKTAGDFNMDSAAVYIQDEWLVNDRLLIIPSIRFDTSNNFDDNYSPKLGLTYKLSDNYRLKANVGKGFKAPTIDDMFMNMSKRMGPFLVNVQGNPDLKPEKSTSYELSLEGEKGKTFGKVTYFMNDVKDLITTNMTRVGMTYYSTYENEDEADIDGIEFEIGHYISDKFTLKANYTYLDATGTDGSRLTGRAEHMGTVQLHYDDNRKNGVNVIFWNEWRKNYLSSVTNSNKSYTMWNLAVNKKWNDKFSGFFGIDNIFDKKDPELSIYGAIVRTGVTMKF